MNTPKALARSRTSPARLVERAHAERMIEYFKQAVPLQQVPRSVVCADVIILKVRAL